MSQPRLLLPASAQPEQPEAPQYQQGTHFHVADQDGMVVFQRIETSILTPEQAISLAQAIAQKAVDLASRRIQAPPPGLVH